MLDQVRLGYQLLDDHVDHGTGGEAQEDAMRDRTVLAEKKTTADPAAVMSHVNPQPIAAQIRDCIRLASNCMKFQLLSM